MVVEEKDQEVAENEKQEQTAGEESQEAAEVQAEAKQDTEPAAESSESQEPDVDLSDTAASILEQIKGLTVLELANLVKALEKTFGVSAQAAVVAAPGGAGGGADGDAPEEKTSFDVVLTAIGDKKIQVIKEIRSLTSLGLKEAKELVDSAPKSVKEGATKDEADEMKEKLEAVGATIELK